jgi:hypothetical protein
VLQPRSPPPSKQRRGYGVQVVAPGASARLGALLSRRGAVVAEGGALRVTVELPAKAAVRKLLERATGR